MIQKFFIAFLLAQTLLGYTASAQMMRTIYEAFEVDSAASVRLDLVGFTNIEVKAWAGNTVLTEVNIKLYDASPEILNYFVDKGRYKFAFERKGENASIMTQVRERKVIRTELSGPKGCQEDIEVRVFVPDNYRWSATLEEDSDGVILESKDDLLRWESGNRNTDNVESYEDSKKHKLVKTLLKKE